MNESSNIEQVRGIFTAYLENKSLRKTPERYTVLEEIYDYEGHFEVEELFDHIKDKGHSMSRATVYNTLDLLVDCDLVTKHQFGKNMAQYERAHGSKQHDHLICTDCHQVIEFCDPRIHRIQNTVGNLLSFDVLHHSLILYGACKKENCENKK